MARGIAQCGALSFFGIVIVSLQLVVVYQLSKHATIVDQTSSINLLNYGRSDCRQSVENTAKNTTVRNDMTHAANNKNIPLSLPADGSFNGIPLFFKHDKTSYSSVACVGENYQPDSFLYRSCHFRHFCLDVEQQDFVIIQTPQERAWLTRHVHRNNSLIGSAIDTNVSLTLGGLNPKWGERDFAKLKWFPRVLEEPLEGYYALPEDYVWVPYHSMAGFNAGHLVWDDFLPIYTLLTMFGLLDGGDFHLQPLLTRVVLKTSPLWATCDFNDDMKQRCTKIMPKFLPLMGVNTSTFSTTVDFIFTTTTSSKPKSKYVCARHGAAGIGTLTDHARKAHGWEPRDYQTTHNIGRGASLYKFRNFMLRNLGIDTSPLSSKARPFHIVFSVSSSESGARNLSFQRQIQAVENGFSRNETHVHAHVLKTLSLEDQVSLASKAAIYVTSAGGGAVTATFLPRGATLIIYYQGDGSRVKNIRTYQPARLDWDLFNHLSYIRVHWLPAKKMDSPDSLEIFTQLIRNELDGIARTR